MSRRLRENSHSPLETLMLRNAPCFPLTLLILASTLSFGCSTPRARQASGREILHFDTRPRTRPSESSSQDGVVGPNRAQRQNLFSPWTGASGVPGWTFDFALGFESEPDYAGSDDNEVEPDAFARALYEDAGSNRYFLSLGELGAWWRLGQTWTLGTVFEYEEARDNENEALQGFEEVDATVEAQITLAKRLGDFTLAGVLQPDVLDRGKGFVTFLGLSYDQMLSERWRFGATADVSFGDAEHMATEFGISAADSAASGLDPYNPSAGLKSSTLGIQLEHSFSPGFSFLLGLELEHYFSRASDSPLISQEGSDTTYEASIGLRYSL